MIGVAWVGDFARDRIDAAPKADGGFELQDIALGAAINQDTGVQDHDHSLSSLVTSPVTAERTQSPSDP